TGAAIDLQSRSYRGSRARRIPTAGRRKTGSATGGRLGARRAAAGVRGDPGTGRCEARRLRGRRNPPAGATRQEDDPRRRARGGAARGQRRSQTQARRGRLTFRCARAWSYAAVTEPAAPMSNPYDEFAYRSAPVEWSAPERLALTSLLHGGPRPGLERYRVL